MAVIVVGAGATDRSGAASGANYTSLSKANPANGSGPLSKIELWFATAGSGVKAGTFSGADTTWDDRDYGTIGDVPAGSKQTFNGLNIDIVTGDLVGEYHSGGTLERDTSGGAGQLYAAGDKFGNGPQSYALHAAYEISIYGEGTTVEVPPFSGCIV